MSEGEKWPRQYAADYLAAGTDKAKQRAALKGCPEAWRELVKDHIKIARDKTTWPKQKSSAR
jgi:hypothetical protein